MCACIHADRLDYQWRQLGRRLTKFALSMSMRHMAHVVSTAAGSGAAAKTVENSDVGTDFRRNEDARAAISSASAAIASGDCSVDSSESCADSFEIKRVQMSITKRPAQIIKSPLLVKVCLSVIGVGLGVEKFSEALTYISNVQTQMIFVQEKAGIAARQ